MKIDTTGMTQDDLYQLCHDLMTEMDLETRYDTLGNILTYTRGAWDYHHRISQWRGDGGDTFVQIIFPNERV